MIPIFFINLDRRVDRRDSCLEQLRQQNYPMTSVFRYTAKDAQVYPFSQEELSLFTKADFMMDQKIRAPIMCNFLSHYDLWKLTVQHNFPYLLIAQDDIVFRKDLLSSLKQVLQSLPEDTEVVWLGLPEQVKKASLENCVNTFYVSRVNEQIVRLPPLVNPCSLFYIITLQGAKNLLEYTQKVGVKRATDWFMNDYLSEKGIHYASSTILATNDEAFGSDIF